jgi:mono/diheme cytochrome c family protein
VKGVLVLLLLMLPGCDLSMKNQPKQLASTSAAMWPGGPSRQAPEGRVAFEAKPAGAERIPPRATRELAAAGGSSYTIYCAACHGPDGEGNGPVVARGYPNPPSLVAADACALSGPSLFRSTADAAAYHDFTDRLESDERWATVLFMRALQEAGGQC